MKTYEEIYNVIINTIVKEFKKDRALLTPTTNFKELGLDSLDKVDLLCELEQWYGKELINDENKIYEQKFYVTKTLEDLTKLILEVIQKESK